MFPNCRFVQEVKKELQCPTASQLQAVCTVMCAPSNSSHFITLVLQDPLQRPNFVAVLDHLSDLQEAGEMTKMDAYYNSHGCVFI